MHVEGGVLLTALSLFCNEQLRLLGFHFFIVSSNLLRNPGFRDTNCNNFNSRSPDKAVTLKSLLQVFIECFELSDVYFLQRVRRAKLVDFVVNLIKDPRLVVLGSIVSDRLQDEIFF